LPAVSCGRVGQGRVSCRRVDPLLLNQLLLKPLRLNQLLLSRVLLRQVMLSQRGLSPGWPSRRSPRRTLPGHSPPDHSPLDRSRRGRHGRDRLLRPVVSERHVRPRFAGTVLTAAHPAQPLGVPACQSPIAMALVIATEFFAFGRIVAAGGPVAHHSQFGRGEKLQLSHASILANTGAAL
jgi:hypothetical protein